MIISTPNNGTIEVNNTLTGKEIVKYNGIEVSAKRTVSGGTHLFQVSENDEIINYEVDINTRWHGMSYYFIVRRNGAIIFTNK